MLLNKLVAQALTEQKCTAQRLAKLIAESDPEEIQEKYLILKNAAKAISDYPRWSNLQNIMLGLENLKQTQSSEQIQVVLKNAHTELSLFTNYVETLKTRYLLTWLKNTYQDLPNTMCNILAVNGHLILMDLFEKLRHLDSYVYTMDQFFLIEPAASYLRFFNMEESSSSNKKYAEVLFKNYCQMIDDIHRDYEPTLMEILCMVEGCECPFTYEVMYIAAEVRKKHITRPTRIPVPVLSQQ